jgi:predicted HTH transcriptional regulator
MANRQDGGLVVIGVVDDGVAVAPIGLTNEQLDTWTHDAAGDALAEYADPAVEFALERVPFQGMTLVVLRVQEFDDVPVLCKRDYPQTQRKGACYVRARRKPETSEIPTQAEMRELIDLATSKRLRKTLGMLRGAGVDLSTTASPGDVQLFDRQIKDLL